MGKHWKYVENLGTHGEHVGKHGIICERIGKTMGLMVENLETIWDLYQCRWGKQESSPGKAMVFFLRILEKWWLKRKAWESFQQKVTRIQWRNAPLVGLYSRGISQDSRKKSSSRACDQGNDVAQYHAIRVLAVSVVAGRGYILSSYHNSIIILLDMAPLKFPSKSHLSNSRLNGPWQPIDIPWYTHCDSS